MAVEGRKLYQSIVRDSTERKKNADELQKSKDDLRTILDRIDSGFVLIDPDTHVIVDINSYAVELIGAPREQIVNRVCHQFICPAETGRCPISDLQQTVDTAERVLLTASGERVPILKTVSQVMLQGRNYFIESFIDITELKKSEQELEKRDVLLGRWQRAPLSARSERCIRCYYPGIGGIGRDAGVDRVYIFKNHADPQTGEHLMSQLYEWSDDSVTAQIDNPELQNLSYALFSGWYEILAYGGPVKGLVRDFTATIRGHLDLKNIRSMLLVPISLPARSGGSSALTNVKRAHLVWKRSIHPLDACRQYRQHHTAPPGGPGAYKDRGFSGEYFQHHC